jgi:single-strand DNA-binding protein
MINNVILIGRLVREPELRKSSSGNSIANFTIAVDNRTKNPDGTRSTSFIPCVAFNQTADNVVKFVHKGSQVAVQGGLSQRTYQKQDGTKVSIFEILCDAVQFLEPKKDDKAPTEAALNIDTPIPETDQDNDFLPF